MFKKKKRDGADGGDSSDGEDGKGKSSISSKMSSLMQKGLKVTQHSATLATKELKHSVGLGSKPNVVPDGKADANGDQRTIEIGWHPVAGATGKWFAEKTIIGKQITERVGKYPDPTQHWAVIVGNYVHELWMDENLDIIYINEEFDKSGWTTYEVGKTRFNDQALRKASQMTIHNMREKRPAYNLISNNCQNFAVNLLDNVQLGAHKKFATSYSVYQTATGDHDFVDLFKEDGKPSDEPDADEQEMPHPKRQDTLQFAQDVMEQHTTTLDHGD